MWCCWTWMTATALNTSRISPGRLRAKVLVLTCVGDAGLLGRVLAVGARGIFRKHEPPAQLLRAIEMVAMGEVFPSGALLHRWQMPPPQSAPEVPPRRSREPGEGKLSSLTKRERQTIEAVVADASAPAKVIAGRLGISEHTLRNHLTSIYSKLEVSGRLGLQAFAMQQQGMGRRPC
jgi:DNA-binding NarL/FixJ family response regulator